MAKQSQFKKAATHKSVYRYFSTELKQKIISDLDKGFTTIAEISREYEVSRSAVSK